MVYYLITCRSLTYAQRTARVLERAGITAVILRAPRELSRAGCGYCVKVSNRRLSQALRVLKQADVSYNKVYIVHPNGETAEVAL